MTQCRMLSCLMEKTLANDALSGYSPILALLARHRIKVMMSQCGSMKNFRPIPSRSPCVSQRLLLLHFPHLQTASGVKPCPTQTTRRGMLSQRPACLDLKHRSSPLKVKAARLQSDVSARFQAPLARTARRTAARSLRSEPSSRIRRLEMTRKRKILPK